MTKWLETIFQSIILFQRLNDEMKAIQDEGSSA